MEKESFLKQHGDAAAVIGVQIGIAALLLTVMIWMGSTAQAQISSMNARQDAMNARLDTVQMLIYQEMKDFHGRLCSLEERRNK